MNAPIYNEEHRQWARGKIVVLAKGIVAGELSIVAGARQLAGWRFDVGAENDPDFIFFVGVDRSRSNPEALAAKDEELRDYEGSVRERALRACRSLIQKYEIDAV